MQKICVCHIPNIKGRTSAVVVPFDDERKWKKLCKYVSLWKGLDGVERAIAENFDFTTARNRGYHVCCFYWFTDGQRVRCAKERLQDEKINATLVSLRGTTTLLQGPPVSMKVENMSVLSEEERSTALQEPETRRLR